MLKTEGFPKGETNKWPIQYTNIRLNKDFHRSIGFSQVSPASKFSPPGRLTSVVSSSIANGNIAVQLKAWNFPQPPHVINKAQILEQLESSVWLIYLKKGHEFGSMNLFFCNFHFVFIFVIL